MAGREPLFFRMVKTMDDGQEVRVHVKCENDTKAFFTVNTAQPTDEYAIKNTVPRHDPL